jgi:WD40 repeat protein
LIDTVTGHSVGTVSDVLDARFSRDGRRLIVTMRGYSLLFNAIDGTQIGSQMVGELSLFSPDGSRIVTEFGSGTASKLWLWDTDTGAKIDRDIAGMNTGFSRTGARFCASNDPMSSVWDAVTGNEIAELPGKIVGGCPDADRAIVEIPNSNQFSVWGLTAGRSKGTKIAAQNSDVSPGAQKLFTLGGQAHDPDELKEMVGDAWIKSTVPAKSRKPPATFSPNGDRVATYCREKELCIWDSADGRPIAVVPGTEISFSIDGSRFITKDDINISHGKAWLWWALDGHQIGTIDQAKSAPLPTFSDDGSRIITYEEDPNGSVVHSLWDTATGLRVGDRLWKRADFTLSGTRLLTESDDKVWFVSAATGQAIAVFDDFKGAVSQAYSPDKKTAVLYDDNRAWLFDVNSGQKLALLHGHDDGIKDVRFSPDGGSLAILSTSGMLRTLRIDRRREDLIRHARDLREVKLS